MLSRWLIWHFHGALDIPATNSRPYTSQHVLYVTFTGALKDNLVGEEYIADYLLFWLNTHQKFEYVCGYFTARVVVEALAWRTTICHLYW